MEDMKMRKGSTKKPTPLEQETMRKGSDVHIHDTEGCCECGGNHCCEECPTFTAPETETTGGPLILRKIDKYGRKWPFPENELCPECGQPDSCGDCNHKRLTDKDVRMLLEGENSEPTEKATARGPDVSELKASKERTRAYKKEARKIRLSTGPSIRKLRKLLRYSMQEVADGVGISVANLSRAERGEVPMGQDKINKAITWLKART